jgi:hypothetical protein
LRTVSPAARVKLKISDITNCLNFCTIFIPLNLEAWSQATWHNIEGRGLHTPALEHHLLLVLGDNFVVKGLAYECCQVEFVIALGANVATARQPRNWIWLRVVLRNRIKATGKTQHATALSVSWPVMRCDALRYSPNVFSEIKDIFEY